LRPSSRVLASTPAARIRWLTEAGVPFTARPARIDEEAIIAALQDEDAPARDIAETLAEHKARRLASDDQTQLTIGSDQVLAIQGKVLQKPKHRADAADHLSLLQGKTHHLYSGVVIYEGPNPVWRHIGSACMTMHPLNSSEIDAYLEKALPEVSGCVGAYQAEALGAQLFRRIGGDWFTVQGIPLLDVLSSLRQRRMIAA